jgi:hypothetical protein
MAVSQDHALAIAGVVSQVTIATESTEKSIRVFQMQRIASCLKYALFWGTGDSIHDNGIGVGGPN